MVVSSSSALLGRLVLAAAWGAPRAAASAIAACIETDSKSARLLPLTGSAWNKSAAVGIASARVV
jgi:hypothetical protein